VKITPQEWADSQEHELEYWRDQYRQGNPEQAARWHWYALVVMERWFGKVSLAGLSVCDYGSGPEGVLHHIRAQRRVAVDPLMPEYVRLGFCVNGRDGGIEARASMPDEVFDVAFCMNMLDHTADPAAELRGLAAHLREGGTLVMVCDLRPAWKMDACHKLRITDDWLCETVRAVGLIGERWLAPHQTGNPTVQWCAVLTKGKDSDMKRAKRRGVNLAVVCAWREGETDLQATIDDAGRSAGEGVTIYPVEDQAHEGPGRTRNRGIEAASGADVICVIDAHMRFEGDVLARMARHVARSGGLVCPMVHHNAECSMTGPHYAGARIVYRAKDGNAQNALAGKWSRDLTPGPRGCVMGACYVFRRDWYMLAGQPLAALPGWGCDEEALSIAAWLSGHTPEVFDGHAAHLYRPRPPWAVTDADHAAVHASRIALVHCVATDLTDRRELETWQRARVPEGIPACTSPEAERFRVALLAMPRKWRQWRQAVCEPDELDGVQAGAVAIPVDRPKERPSAPRPTPTTMMHGVTCTHCRSVFDPLKIRTVNTYPNGNRRHICPQCGNPFISLFRATP
jgi:SAM-dependent methyltransferase